MHLETLIGEVAEARVLGRDFWGSARVRPSKGGAECVVVGKLLGVQPGDTIEAQGVWTEHEKFGKQFKARTIETRVPRDASGVVAWLASRLPQLGPNRARALVEELGVEGVWHTIEHDPDRLLDVQGITPERRDMIVKAYHEHRGERDRIVRFKAWGFTDGQIARVLDEWGDRAEAILRENPFALSERVHGFGFKRADAVATRMGLPHDAPARIRAGIMHTLVEASEGHGHVYIPGGALVGASARLLDLGERVVARELELLVTSKRVHRVFVGETSRVSLVDLDEAEECVAQSVRELACHRPEVRHAA
jgi:exodeoxyribonuclease V alpha subunit